MQSLETPMSCSATGVDSSRLNLSPAGRKHGRKRTFQPGSVHPEIRDPERREDEQNIRLRENLYLERSLSRSLPMTRPANSFPWSLSVCRPLHYRGVLKVSSTAQSEIAAGAYTGAVAGTAR